MSFKNKNNKKIQYNNKVTLESKHNEFMDKFIDKGTIIGIEIQINNIKKKISISKDIETIIQLKDEIIVLQEQLYEYNNIHMNNNEIDYLLDNGNIMFKYYDSNVDIYSYNCNDKTGIMSYFNNNKIEHKKKNTKKSLLNRYLLNTRDTNNINYDAFKINTEECNRCNITKLLFVNQGKQICPQCGEETSILIESEKPSYKDPPREITYFSYKRINHFNEWLEQFQAKETTDIPKEIYNLIMVEIKKERIEIHSLTNKMLRIILKKIGKNKYYEHIPHILTKINGKAPPTMSVEIEEELRRMFKEIQVPFHKFCPKTRKNFLSYSYVLHKFVQLLGLKQYYNSFLLLKSREKLHQQDIIWKDICNYLKWEYISSI